ncbi:CAP domain-containing protein [Actinoplanes sp. NPDC049596]|uniref:CAP domain-containing protein n=1 Tax=unclassified Actinoplanes TaxID=2626549 RepID=UPI0034445115
MRKPVVVVCAAASALLLAGGVAATSADADERPDTQGWGGFAFADWPFFGGGGSSYSDGDEEPDDSGYDDRSTVGDDDNSIDDYDNPDDEAPGFAAPQADEDQPDEDQARRQAQRQQMQQQIQRQQAQQRQQDEQEARERQQQAQRQQVQRQQAQRQQVQRPAAAPRAASVTDLARRSVTAADVSASPSAPVQQRVLILVNQNRRKGGCGPLGLDRRLIEAANRHAADMARRDYFEHDSPNGDSAGDRVSRTGYDWKRYSENIARGADSPWEVVDGWMHSPVHRRNILDCRLHEMGLGLALDREHTTYWVQDFATPRE